MTIVNIVAKVVPGSIGKVFGSLLMVLGAIAGLVISILSLADINVLGNQILIQNLPDLTISKLAIIIVPLAGFVFGFFIGAISGFIYNLLASLTGGIEFEFASQD